MSTPVVDHVALTVTDLDVSERFYRELLDLVRLADFGEVRVLVHRASGFTLSLARHGDAGGCFDETRTGLDHLGFAAASRAELEAREAQLRGMGARYTPIRDMPFGWHLNLRDPDGIALEFFAAGPLLAAGLAELRDGDLDQAGIDARAREYLAAAGAS
ncbi:VOC family protein [Geodermatophilus amargosae]|uniref:VOC family protein n=1 Tax=Geodermatophilus amargosae TaxID=1296565 RepID=UPI0034DE28CC